MKIGFVSSLYSKWGGSEELWVRTAEVALEKKHDVYISIYDWGTIHESILSLQRKGATLILRPNELAESTSFVRKALYRLNTFINGNSFKKILSVELDVLLISQGGTYDFSWNKDFKEFLDSCDVKRIYLISQFNSEHEILPYSTIELARNVFKKMTRVFFVSERNKVVAERQIAASIQNAQVISNPVKVPFGKVAYADSSILHLAVVGRLDARVKGQDLLIQALSNPLFNSIDWQLNIYGEGMDEPYLKELVHYYGLSERVNFKGFENDVVKIWKENHVLILTSFAEGTPLSLLEAMACGRTAVVTDVGGCSAFIEDRINGFIIKAPVVSLIEDSLKEMFSRRADLESMGGLSLSKVQELIKHKPEESLYNIITEQK